MTQKPNLQLAQDPAEIRAAVASVEAAIEDIREGRMVILVDDADREKRHDWLRRTVEMYGWRLHAFVLMPNHDQRFVEAP